MAEDTGLERFAEAIVRTFVEIGLVEDRPGEPTVNLSQRPPHRDIVRWVDEDRSE